MACFDDMNVFSQGSVATYARFGGIFNMHLTANLPRNLPVKMCKSVKIRKNYGHESVVPFFWPTLYVLLDYGQTVELFIISGPQGIFIPLYQQIPLLEQLVGLV